MHRASVLDSAPPGGRGATSRADDARPDSARSVARRFRVQLRRTSRPPRPGTYVVPRGWASRLPAGTRVVTEEHEARARGRALADTLRVDARPALVAALDLLAARIDRRHGLVVAVSLAELVEHTGASLATVRRAVARAVAGGVLTRVGDPFSPTVLRTEQGITPTYAFTAPALPEPVGHMHDGACERPPAPTERLLSPKSRDHARMRAAREGRTPWGPQDRARTRGERHAAAVALLEVLGLTRRLDPDRVAAALRSWFAAGWTVRGLVHAIDHDPDGTRIGDAARGAHDVLAVILARLRAWSGRLGVLPADRFAAVERAERLRRAHRRAQLDTADVPPAPVRPPREASAARLAAMAAIRSTLISHTR